MGASSEIDFARSRAILLATSRYTAGFADRGPMPAAVNSVNEMHRLLTGECEWPAERVTRFVDERDSSRLLITIGERIRDVTDVLLFYYVGHGQPLIKRNLYDLGLALTDTSQDPVQRDLTSLRFRDLCDHVDRTSRARIKIFILDCCCSGIATKYQNQANGFGPDAAGELEQGRGTYIWAACGHSQETFFDRNAGGLTYFTKFLAEAVRRRHAEPSSGATIGELHRDVQKRMLALPSSEAVIAPVPALRYTGDTDQFLFVRGQATSLAWGQHVGALYERANGVEPEVSRPVARRRVLLLAGVVVVGGAATYGVVRLVSPDDGKPTVPSVLTGHAAAVSAVAFSPDGTSLASASSDRTVRLWSLETGEVRTNFAGHTAAVNSVAFSPDGRSLASGSSDRTIRLWSLTAGVAETTLAGHTAAVTSVAFSPDGGTLASGSVDRSARLWNVVAGQNVAVLTDQKFPINAISYSGEGTVLLTAFGNGKVRFWNVGNREKMGLLTIYDAISVNAITVASSLIAMGENPKNVALWDGERERSVPSLRTAASVNAVAFHPGGKILAAGMSDASIVMWDTATQKMVGKPLLGHRSAVTSVAFSPNGRTLASGGVDHTVRLWNISGELRPAPVGQK